MAPHRVCEGRPGSPRRLAQQDRVADHGAQHRQRRHEQQRWLLDLEQDPELQQLAIALFQRTRNCSERARAASPPSQERRNCRCCGISASSCSARLPRDSGGFHRACGRHRRSRRCHTHSGDGRSRESRPYSASRGCCRFRNSCCSSCAARSCRTRGSPLALPCVGTTPDLGRITAEHWRSGRRRSLWLWGPSRQHKFAPEAGRAGRARLQQFRLQHAAGHAALQRPVLAAQGPAAHKASRVPRTRLRRGPAAARKRRACYGGLRVCSCRPSPRHAQSSSLTQASKRAQRALAGAHTH